MSEDQSAVRCFVVSGRVQGVGFRWWTRREAQALALVGTVRNRTDGTVEVVATGDERALRELETRLHRGPLAARVTRVTEEPAPEMFGSATDVRSFEIVRG